MLVKVLKEKKYFHPSRGWKYRREWVEIPAPESSTSSSLWLEDVEPLEPQIEAPEGVSRMDWEASPDGTSVPIWAPKRDFPHMALARAIWGMKWGARPTSFKEAVLFGYCLYALLGREWGFKYLRSLPNTSYFKEEFKKIRKLFFAAHQAGGGERLFLSASPWIGGADNEVWWDEEVPSDNEFGVDYEVHSEFYPATIECGRVSYHPGPEYDWAGVPVAPSQELREEEEAELRKELCLLKIRSRLQRWLRKVCGTGLKARPADKIPLPRWAEEEMKNLPLAWGEELKRWWCKTTTTWVADQYETAAKKLDGRKFYAAVQNIPSELQRLAWKVWKRVKK